MKIIFLNICIFCLIHSVYSQDQSSVFFEQADGFLNKYVMDGKVDYKKVSDNIKELETLVSKIGNHDLSNGSMEHKKAFYINAYNLLVIYQIAKQIPVKENWYKNGFFDKVEYKVAGELITLDVLEKKRLWNIDKDPRIHFVLVCGAKGCPPLKSGAYKPGKVEQQLDEQTRKALNDHYFIRVNNKDKQVAVSELMKWYEKDFLNEDKTLVEYINRYRIEKIPIQYKIIFYPYDWKINNI